ncbi:MAG: sulfur carrier protein ThiS [bacterium]
MKIIVNGNEMEFQENISVQGMLDVMNNQNKMIVIEKNLEIISKENFAQTILKDGDNIEIISFVGGG